MCETTGSFSINMRLQSNTLDRKSFTQKAEQRFEIIFLFHLLSLSFHFPLTRSFHLANFHFQIDLCILTFNVVSIYLIDLEIISLVLRLHE